MPFVCCAMESLATFFGPTTTDENGSSRPEMGATGSLLPQQSSTAHIPRSFKEIKSVDVCVGDSLPLYCVAKDIYCHTAGGDRSCLLVSSRARTPSCGRPCPPFSPGLYVVSETRVDAYSTKGNQKAVVEVLSC